MANLLDKASIILTPTAYNNGEALCVKPSDGSGDFDFSRNSAATRVNAQGLVENVQILSSNLVQNGDFSEEGVQEVSNGSFSQEGVEQISNGSFDTDSNWTKGTGWSISGGSANCDGTQSVNTVLVQQGGIKGATINFVVGKTYKVNFDIVVTSGWISNIEVASGYDSNAITTSGNHTTYITAVSTNDRFTITANPDFIGSIDNVSVREVGQDWNLGTGWSIGEDAVNFTYSTPSSLIQDLNVTSGFIYLIEYEIVSNSGVSLKGGGNSFFNVGSSIPTTVGLHSFYVTAVNSLGIDFRYLSGSGSLSITNISVKEVGQNWVLDANWSIAEDKAVSDGSVNGFIRTSTNVFENGKTYKVGITVSNMTTGQVTYPYDGAGSTFITTNGDFSQIYTADDTNRCWIYGRNGFDGSITNISVIEITTDTNLPRINYEGFSYQDALGSELVVNGDFSNGSTDWVVGSDWSISGGTANALSANGTYLTQTSLGNAGKNYLITFTILNYVSGSCAVRFENISTSFNSNGTYTFYTTLAGIRNLDFIPSNFTGSIDNVSVKEYLGQEVVPDSGCGSWLWEPQSTNLITQSNDLSQWIIQQNATVSSPTFVSPSGENNANLIDLSADTDARVVLNFGSASTEYTFSVYLKKHESDVNGTFPLAYYNGSNYIKTYVNLTDKWQRFSLTFTNPSGSVFGYGLSRRGTTSDETLTRCYAWGGQQEALSYPTSLIPTEGSTVTRNQDVCTNGGSLASINSTEGVLYAEIAALANDGTTRIISLSDGTTANRVNLFFDTSNTLRAFITGVPSIATAAVITDNNKVALKFKSGDISVWLNGTEVATSTSTISLSGLSNLSFNQVGSSPFFGKTKALAVWKEALSDEELTELTSN